MPMPWFCKIVNLVMGKGGEFLEYRHLIVNPKTQAMWTHSYGNKIGRLARACQDATPAPIPSSSSIRIRYPARELYGQITCLIRPEKLNKPNRTRLVAGKDRVHYPGNAGTQDR